MSELFFLFAASMMLAAFLSAICIWSHRKTWAKVSAIVATALFIPTVYISYADLLSRPKPTSLEWWHRNAEEATVVGSKLSEGEAIYLWIELPETDSPRAYRLPWAQELAKQLYGAQREAQKNGTRVQMRMPFREVNESRDPVFYAQPQPPLPPKRAENRGGRFFQHSSSRSGRGGVGGG